MFESAFLLDAATFLLRWLHVVAAIAWIGESFYFVALDRGLQPPKDPQPGMAGESWSVHGGGFYHKQKYLPAPAQLPDRLHWSMWKSYTTWLSGFALLSVSYFLRQGVDPLLAVALLAGTWIAYDQICKRFGANDRVLGVLVGVLALAVCLLATHWFRYQAGFVLAGAALATVMSANVFFVIIPGQRRMVQALRNGQAPDPRDGARGKQRSVHNTYFTLPVVFAMLATHYPDAWTHAHRGWLLALFMLAAALIRQFFVVWHSGERAWKLLATGGAVLLLALAWTAHPKFPARSEAAAPSAAATSTDAGETPQAGEAAPLSADTASIHAILRERCAACHSATPSLLLEAPKGAAFDTPEQVESQAVLIHQQTVVLRTMPPGNLTQMTDAERDAIARWFEPLKR